MFVKVVIKDECFRTKAAFEIGFLHWMEFFHVSLEPLVVVVQFSTRFALESSFWVELVHARNVLAISGKMSESFFASCTRNRF